MSCICGTSTVLLSHPQARLDHCCWQRSLVLASHVLRGGMQDLVLHCLAAALLIWTLVAAEASGCFCRVLIVALILTCLWVRSSHPLWVRSSHPLWVRSFLPAVGPLFSTRCGSALCFSSSLRCSSKLLGLLVVLVCPSRSRRARRSHWRTVCLCAACSLTCCAWCAGVTSLRARRCLAQVRSG